MSALAPDLFRIRTFSPSSPEARTSWAVVPPSARRFQSTVVAKHGRVFVATDNAKLELSLKTGAWALCDNRGLSIFVAAAPGLPIPSTAPSIELELADRESIFGLGEVAGGWNSRGRTREFWNTDVLGVAPAIHPAIPSLYVSIPFALSLRDGRAAGLFWDNPGRQTWDVGSSSESRWTLTAATGELDLYLFAGPTVPGVLERYTEWTGRIPLPPRWGLGYHQSRYSYATAAEVEKVAREFRSRRLPCDALYLDIHSMDRYRVFTFGAGFPNPNRLLNRLKSRGFKVVTIVDPGVKEDPDFEVYQRGLARQAFVRAPDGQTDFVGEVWPGKSKFPDFLSSSVRQWWGEEQAFLWHQGVSGFWNDMNEPANFARPDKTLDPDCVHPSDDSPCRHEEVHNAYGSEMARASREGIIAHGEGFRPFVITRAGYAGLQRHALVWTGDNSSTWEHLRDVIPQLLNLSLSGVSYCGADVGGFLGNCTPELFVRWFQLATFTPFFRNHSNIGTRAQEPWAFGPEIEEICRSHLRLRYRLLPHLYSLLSEARASGVPLMRPLLWHYANDSRSVACGSQFLVGRDLLVAPILDAGERARSVYLPPDLWFDFWTGEKWQGGQDVLVEAPLDTVPLFVRGGAIIALGGEPFGPDSAINKSGWSGVEDRSLVTLRCWRGTNGGLDWYEDDEETEAYVQGAFLRRQVRLFGRGRSLKLEFSQATGSFQSRVQHWRILVSPARNAARVRFQGKSVTPLIELDEGLFGVDIPNHAGEMSVEWTGL